MKVRTLTLQAGPRGVVPVGSVLDVSASQAREWIAAGYAEAVAEPATPARSRPESAAVRPPENAARRGSAPRAPADPESIAAVEAVAAPAATPSQELQDQLEPPRTDD